MENNTRRAFKSRMDAKQDVWRAIPALMGDGNGTIEVPNQPNYVYIRVGDGDLGQAFNNRCQLRDNLAIYVGYDPITDPDRRTFQVLSVRMADYAGAGNTTVPNVGPHHTTHEFGGGDDVYIDWRRLMGLRVGRPAAFVVTVDPGYIYRAGWIAIPSTTVDLTAEHTALVGTQAQYTLISLSSVGVVTHTNGTPVISPAVLTIADVPTPPAGHIPLAAVRLYKMQTAIGDTPGAPDIVDLRFPTYNTASAYVTPHDILGVTHTDTLAGAVVDGDTIIGNVTPKWSRLAISIPAANVRNVLGVDNGELRPSWKTALDATAAADIAGTAAAGTSLLFSHRDHVHRGVVSVNKSGGATLYGAVTLSEGANITLTQVGQDIAIAAAGGGGAHDILSATHTDTLADGVVDGDVIIGNVTPKWARLAISIPAANVRNTLGIDNGELRPSWKTTLDATNPTTIGIADAGGPGTSLIYSHRDHQHPSPAAWTAAAHDIFSAIHGDTTGAASPVDGDIIIGNVTPKWSKLAISIPAANVRNVLGIDNGELRPSWKTALDATAPTTIAEGAAAAAGTSLIFSHRDHTHGAPATWAATAHNILDSTYHGDVLTGAITRGDILYGNATPKIARLALGGIAGSVVTRDATDVLWSAGALSFGGAFTLTVPATGTATLGTGTQHQLAVWSGTNTITGLGAVGLNEHILQAQGAGNDPGWSVGSITFGGAFSELGLPNASTIITGGGTLALGGFTLTVPATGTAALLGTANVFTATQTISGVGNRIAGDFSNATHASRLLFQSSTVNGNTLVGALPNGTGTTAAFNIYGNSDLTVALSFGQFRVVAATAIDFNSTLLNAGTQLPLTLSIASVAKLTITTAGHTNLAGGLNVGGDSGGLAGNNSLSNVSDVSANSTGVGTIKFKGATNRDSTGFIKIYIGTTAYYVPVFAAITG